MTIKQREWADKLAKACEPFGLKVTPSTATALTCRRSTCDWSDLDPTTHQLTADSLILGTADMYLYVYDDEDGVYVTIGYEVYRNYTPISSDRNRIRRSVSVYRDLETTEDFAFLFDKISEVFTGELL